MARTRLSRRAGPVGAALMMWNLWLRMSPRQRRWLVAQARRHGPRLARQAVDAQRRRTGRR